MRGRDKWLGNGAYRLGRKFDDRARGWLTESRCRWIIIGFLAFVVFESLAPWEAVAQPGHPRVLAGVAFAAVVVAAGCALARVRREP
jgi:hypothetical protein